jgi:hypothetical protein
MRKRLPARLVEDIHKRRLSDDRSWWAKGMSPVRHGGWAGIPVIERGRSALMMQVAGFDYGNRSIHV